MNILSHQNSTAQKSVGAEEVLFALVEALHEAWGKGPEADRVTVPHPQQSRNWWVQLVVTGWSEQVLGQHDKVSKGQRDRCGGDTQCWPLV